MNLEEEMRNQFDLIDTGATLQVHRGDDGMIRARANPMPYLRSPMRQAEPQSLEQTVEELPAVVGGFAGGATAATVGLPGDIAGLAAGAYKALYPDEGEGRLEAFTNTLTDISDKYGSGAVKGYLRDQAEQMGASDVQMEALEEAMTVGEFGGVGGIAKGVATKGPQMLSKAGDVIEGAGEGAKARMAEGGATLGAGVDPDPLIAAAGDAVKAMRGGVSEIKITKTTDISDTFGQGAKSVTYTDPQSGGFIEVVQRKDGPTSVLALEVPEQFRGSGIGQKLQAAAMADNPELQGQVSSKAAAVGAYRLGRRPVSNPDATLNEVFDIIDEQSSVLMKMPEQPGDAVAKFRAPTEKQPGVIAFHGSGADFDEFKLEKIGTGEGAQAYGYGLYFTDSEDIAKFYRDTVSRGQGGIPQSVPDNPEDIAGELALDINFNKGVFGDIKQLQINSADPDYDFYIQTLDDNAIETTQSGALKTFEFKDGSIISLLNETVPVFNGKALDSVYTSDVQDVFGAEIADIAQRAKDMGIPGTLEELTDDATTVLSQLGQGLGSKRDMSMAVESLSPSGQGAPSRFKTIYNHFIEPKSTIETTSTVTELGSKKGKMYKVGLEPKPEDMLDYQTTFADQPKSVQDAVKKLGFDPDIQFKITETGDGRFTVSSVDALGRETTKDFVDGVMGQSAKQQAEEYASDQSKKMSQMPMPIILDQLKTIIAQEPRKPDAPSFKKKDAEIILSQRLLEQGVPGIKYRAAGSRAASVDAADAEMNYVIFDDKMIKILEKYGIVGPVAITGIAASQQEGESDGRSA